MNYKELESYLFTIRDEKFAEFSKSLSNSKYLSIGVKNPELRMLIKNHINDEELVLTDFTLGKYLEVDFIYFGLSISRLKDVDEQLLFLVNNVKNAASWAITDCLSSFMKKVSFEKYQDFFFKMYHSSYIYDRRMAYVLGLKHYQNKEILSLFKYFTLNDEYMVMMSEAWLLATIAIYFPQEVFNYLKGIDDLILKRKTISKINDSRRINNDLKEQFKSLR